MRSKAPNASGFVPTLADVAGHAGVSTATVSRCINTPEQVQKKTRDKVLRAVTDLGYSPNFSAQSLAAKRTNTIGAIIPTMDNSIFARGIQAVQEELGRAGATLLVASSSYRPALEAEQIRALVARGADGLLLIGHQRDGNIYEFLDRQQVPVVVSWAYDPAGAKPSIGFDNRAAMRTMATEVLARGHRRIAVISARQADNDRARARVAGIRDAMEEAGLDHTNLPVFETNYTIEEGSAALASLISSSPAPTAVICGNDVLAVGALLAAQSLGMRVPQDLSITGFDDIELSTVTSPALTTVHVPHRKMGVLAARQLWQMVTEQVPGDSLRLDTEVRLRGTLGPPAN
ncbi:MAG: LacI family DNA-binding transcriptional regulator [Pseudomonadota bacterium]